MTGGQTPAVLWEEGWEAVVCSDVQCVLVAILTCLGWAGVLAALLTPGR